MTAPQGLDSAATYFQPTALAGPMPFHSRFCDPFAAIAAPIEYTSITSSGRRQHQNGLIASASPVCDRGDRVCLDDLRHLLSWL